MLFSGDIGPTGQPLLADPQVPDDAHVVVMETTNGDRDHRALAPSVDEFLDTVRAADDRGGDVIIPTFALERAPELLWFLREGMEDGRIRDTLQEFLGSPMAISATWLLAATPRRCGPRSPG